MPHAVPFTSITEEGVLISSWRRIWELTVGTSMIILVYFVSLLFNITLTMLILNPLPMKRLIVYYYVICQKILSIKIWTKGQPIYNQIKLVESHILSLSVNVWQNISSKNSS